MAGNGDLPPSALGYVEGHRIRADLVPQTQAMHDAALRDGVNLTITQGYRSYAQQVALFTERYTRTYLPGRPSKIWNGTRWYQRPGTAVAAVPGTSNHGDGEAIDYDLNAPGSLTWLTKNGPKYGWRRPAWTFIAGMIEPWHWEAIFVLVSNPGPTVPTVPTVPTIPDIPDINPLEDDDMPVVVQAPGFGKAVLDGGRLLGIGDSATVDGFNSAGVKTVPVSDRDFERWAQADSDTWILYNPERGYAVWSGGRGIGLGSKALVDQWVAKGAEQLTVDQAADFDRLTTG